MMTAQGTFDVELTPGDPELNGAVNRFALTKTFDGDLRGRGAGIMLSCGNPQSGSAGYVAIETVNGQLGEKHGSFVLAQLGTMDRGTQTLYYVVVPGSGQIDLKGITGALQLTIEADGTHRYQLDYQV
jgi:hypothetical protein